MKNRSFFQVKSECETESAALTVYYFEHSMSTECQNRVTWLATFLWISTFLMKFWENLPLLQNSGELLFWEKKLDKTLYFYLQWTKYTVTHTRSISNTHSMPIPSITNHNSYLLHILFVEYIEPYKPLLWSIWIIQYICSNCYHKPFSA